MSDYFMSRIKASTPITVATGQQKILTVKSSSHAVIPSWQVPCFDLYCNVINCSSTRLAGGEPKPEVVATLDISPKLKILEEVEPLKVEECSALQLLPEQTGKLVYTIEISDIICCFMYNMFCLVVLQNCMVCICQIVRPRNSIC